MNNDIIQKEVEKIKHLRAEYDSRVVFSPNLHETIEAYHKWYEESCVIFSHYFDENNKEYANFSNVNNDVNGYGLYANYQKIRKDFCVLIDKLERGDLDLKTKNAVVPTLPTVTSVKRIFISHASKDNELIGKFVDSIFLLGMAIDSEIIAYTSREDTGVPAGECIPQFIQDNIACADIVLLMISDNYKKSEVCLNEMGAAWALNKHIIQVLLPNTSFEKLGWLCSLDKALKIDNEESIDALCEVFADRLNIGIKPSAWNRNKAAFISYCTTASATTLPAIIEPEIVDVAEEDFEELGFLDYRESLEIEVANVSQICIALSDAILKHNDMLNSNTGKLQYINSLHPNTSQVKAVMKSTAKGMDDLSVIFESNTPLLQTSFFNVVDNGMKMRTLVVAGSEENMQDNYNAIGELLKSISVAKSGCISFREALDVIPKAERNINKSKKRLINNLDQIIIVLDECISKAQELLKSFL